MSHPVEIPCPCPNAPHERDTVNLRDTLGLRAGIAIQKLIVDANSAGTPMGAADLSGVLAEGYLLFGVESWTFVDETGEPVPVNETTIRAKLLDSFTVGAPIADAADDIYMGPIILPLVVRASTSSRGGPTEPSTFQPPANISKARKRSKPSLTSSIPTGNTGPISS